MIAYLVSFDTLEHFYHSTLSKNTENTPFTDISLRQMSNFFVRILLICLTFCPRGPGSPGGPWRRKHQYIEFSENCTHRVHLRLLLLLLL